ncbi:MAG: thioredoxin family protein [Myxococcota bacterium]
MTIIALTLLAAASAEVGPPPTVPATAQGETAIDDGKAQVQGYLIADVAQVTQDETFRAGVLFQMAPEWHIYWRNPGDAAIPTDLGIESLQAKIGELRWPMPQVFRESNGFITTYGYSGEVLLHVPVRVTEKEGTLELAARADFLACKVECVPGSLELTRTIPFGNAVEPSPERNRFDVADRRVPESNRPGITVMPRLEFERLGPDQSFRAWFEVGCDGCESIELGRPLADAFVPDAIETVVDLKLERVLGRPSGLVLEVSGATTSDRAPPVQVLSGVVALTVDGKLSPVELSVDLPRGRTTVRGEVPSYGVNVDDAAATALPLWQILAFALLGGLLLNLMPCVLPVLAIKVVSFTQLAHHRRSEVLPHTVAYGIAVVGSMAVLAMVVIGFKAAGSTIGWGFQFQSPLFVALVGAILVAFALNLFGVFEVSVGAAGLTELANSASGVRRSFFEGVLAVVLATPCTAPLLGTAVGFALSQSASIIMLVFVTIGIGLAAPFMLLTVVPGWSRLIPKPGGWMITLKHILAFALLGSAVWMVWIVGRGYGADAMAMVLAYFVAVGAAAWIYGRMQLGPRPLVGAASALAVVVVAGWLTLGFGSGAPRENEIEWQRYTAAAVQSELDSGRPVFVNFTADWCITCKVNERTVLAEPSVREAAAAHDVALYKADWTKPDPAIERALAAYGKAGVPAYVLYSPERPARPTLLPELLTVATLEEAFRSALKP